MFEYLSHLYTEWVIRIKKLDYEQHYDKIEIKARGNIHALITLLVCLFMSAWIGILIESIIVLSVIQVTRLIIGGRHWNLDMCFLLTTTICIISSIVGMLASKIGLSLSVIFLYVSYIIIAILPSLNANQKISNDNIHKKYSVLMIFLLTIVYICDKINLINVINSISMAFIAILITSKDWRT